MARKKEQNKIVSNGANLTKELEKTKLTDEEKTRLENYRQRLRKKPVRFKSEKSKAGNIAVSFVNPDDPLMFVKMSEALGTSDSELQQHLINQVVQTFNGVVSKEETNFDIATTSINQALSILDGIQPKDEIEGMLAVQMIGVHNIAMRTMGLAMIQGQGFEAKQANVEQATKMLRTFISQMETLKRYRTSSQIKMVVGSFSVSDGGQAIVGTVNQSSEKKT
ncbi:MAG: hypothetical protein A2173_00845 [Planctomycetes bacterium RBG_13_44_8b]|nr:MAG: hypothetical protein A2173_00845 [Planctomycetes bacterium RBG_13_44_8b]